MGRLRAWMTGAALCVPSSLLCFGACHKVDLPGDTDQRDAGPRYDVLAAPLDAHCGDTHCAYATIGLPEPTPMVYTDQGPASTTASFRALVSLPIQSEPLLAQAIAGMYTPGSRTFRQYLTAAEWATTYAPSQSTVAIATEFITSSGMTIVRTSTNGLLIEFSGSVAAFNAAFHTTLHNFTRANPEQGLPSITVYGVTAPAIAPVEFVHAISSIVTCDTPVATGSIPPQPGTPGTTPPPNIRMGLTPAQIQTAYDVTPLASAGSSGRGVTIGLVSGGAFGTVDLQTFWQSFAISRANPTVILTMEPPIELADESTIDAEWAGAMAPDADIIAYEGADALDTSLLFTFHEAIGRDEVQIVSDSFSSREDSEALAVAQAYDAAAMEAAALGITVFASSGDGGKPDIPSASSYVTAVGGTLLTFDEAGTDFTEVAWSNSGSGITNFSVPSWQTSAVTGALRMTADVSLNGGPYYWWYYLGKWETAYGTSFASPTMAGIVADVQSARVGQPAIGFLNSILYTTPAVQQAFRDIILGGTADYPAGIGWDPPTGWGVVQAAKLATALP